MLPSPGELPLAVAPFLTAGVKCAVRWLPGDATAAALAGEGLPTGPFRVAAGVELSREVADAVAAVGVAVAPVLVRRIPGADPSRETCASRGGGPSRAAEDARDGTGAGACVDGVVTRAGGTLAAAGLGDLGGGDFGVAGALRGALGTTFRDGADAARPVGSAFVVAAGDAPTGFGGSGPFAAAEAGTPAAPVGVAVPRLCGAAASREAARPVSAGTVAGMLPAGTARQEAVASDFVADTCLDEDAK